jgi:predicted transcriptional regulator/transcriptional regulator with XRE-family HTH domain
VQTDLFGTEPLERPAERVLMSLNSEYYELIWQGLKTHEFRRRYLAGRPTTWFVYLTAPTSTLAAVIELDEAVVESPRAIADIAERANTGNGASVFAYLEDLERGYALPIRTVREYEGFTAERLDTMLDGFIPRRATRSSTSIRSGRGCAISSSSNRSRVTSLWSILHPYPDEREGVRMVGRGHRTTTTAMSPLRQARMAIPATLEQVCADLDQRSLDGSSGVTPGMLSGWELGKHTTSIRHRKTLADYYAQPPEALFAHQDQQLTAIDETPRLLVGHHDLREAMTDVVRTARTCLAVVGSRSRDAHYLEVIEATLVERPELVHYRVLFGPPRHQVLKDHLLRLIKLRDPHDRSLGLKTLHIGLVDDDPGTPERFFCTSEAAAVVPIPSVTSAEAFDSGVMFEARVAERLIDHARQVYAAARRVETEQALLKLPTNRS